MRSINGWPVLDGYGDDALRSYAVPGTGIKLLLLDGPVGALLTALAADYHATVHPLRAGECWAFARRAARTSATSWSDHSSGTAIDLNSAHEGAQGPNGGMDDMTKAQIAACVAIKARYSVVIWGGDKARGGDYGQPRYWDPMHFALRPGVTTAQVKAVCVALGINADGHRVTPAPKPAVKNPAKAGSKATPSSALPVVKVSDVQPGDRNSAVKLVQQALNLSGIPSRRTSADGAFGPLTQDAYRAWQRHCHYTGSAADGVPGIESLEKLAAKMGTFTVEE
jgi:hypothetical protein